MSRYIFIFLLIIETTAAIARTGELNDLYNKGDYFRMRDLLETSGHKLDMQNRLYYSSIVNNAFNKNELSLAQADSLLNMGGTKLTDTEMVALLEVQMDCYSKLYLYKQASKVCSAILQQYSKIMDEQHIASLQNIGKIFSALKDVPPLTCTQVNDMIVPINRNKLGLQEIPAKVHGSNESFIFDTGANISTVSESYADKLGIRRLDVSFSVSASQGKGVESGLGVLDSIDIGGMIFKNIVFIIIPDSKLDFPQAGFKINGIIGFPVISAMKEIHLAKDGHLSVPLKKTNKNSRNFCLNGLFPIIMATTDDDTLSFQFDTGAASTDLFITYFEKHKEKILATAEKSRKKYGGAGGTKVMKVYELENFRFVTGDDTVTLPTVNVLTTTTKRYGKEFAHGNMGQDVFSQFREMVISFEDMYIDFAN